MTDDLTAFVERFLTERRRLGFQLTSCAYSLRSFAEHVRASGHRGPLTVEVMARWAREDSSRSDQPRAWAQRLRQLRSFARWLRQFEPSTEVPDDSTIIRIYALAVPLWSMIEVATGAIRAEEIARGDGRIPIIGVTAHALDSDREACLAAGMDDYLSKPISPELLMRKIEQWSGRPVTGIAAEG